MSAKSTKRSSPPVEPGDLTDWDRVRGMSEGQIEAGAASDPDNPPWTNFRCARVVRAGSAQKPVIWGHVDQDVREWVHQRRGDTDQLINDMLRTLMEREREETGSQCSAQSRESQLTRQLGAVLGDTLAPRRGPP